MRSSHLHSLALLATVFSGPSALGAQARPVSYEVSFPNAGHHEAEIRVTFAGVPATVPLEVTFKNRGATILSRLVLAENPRMELVTAESAGVEVSASALENRRRWLASKAGPHGAPR